MAGNTIQLEVVTPNGLAVEEEVDQVEAPSVFGEFGVLPGHLPLLAALRAGVVRYRHAGKVVAVAVGPGFAEAGPERVTVLTDVAIEGSKVDTAAVRGDREQVERKLSGYTGETDSSEYTALMRQREWLDAQLDAATESGKSS